MEPINVTHLIDDLITHAAKITGAPPSKIMSQKLFSEEPTPMRSLGCLRAAIILAAVENKEAFESFDSIQRLVGTPDELPTVTNIFEMLYGDERHDGTFPRLQDLDKKDGMFRIGLQYLRRYVGEIGGKLAIHSNRNASNIFLGLRNDREWASAMGSAFMSLSYSRNLRHENDSIQRVIKMIDDGFRRSN